MTIHLPEDLERSIRAEVQSGHFASVDDAIAEAWRTFQLRRDLRPAGQGRSAASEDVSTPAPRPIWEEIEEITAGIPDEEFRKLPVDGAEQHDHYIYGTPKRPPAP
jgi:Arc/MetJ-type ribon-helix-helix transcriptional regulator